MDEQPAQAVERMHAEVLRLVYSNVDWAEQIAVAAFDTACTVDDPRARGFAHRALGHVAYARDRYAEAVAHYQDALRELDPAGLDEEIGRTLSGAIQPLSLLGRYSEAYQWAERARRIFEQTHDELRLARLDSNLGNILYRQDRYHEALDHYNLARERFLHIGQPLDLTAVNSNLAVCHTSLGHFEKALEYYGMARAHAAAHGQDLLVSAADYNIAYLHYLRGDYLRAMELYQESRIHCERAGDAHHAALCDLDESDLCLELNLDREARYLAQQAAVGFSRLHMPYEQAKALANLGLAESRRGDCIRALRSFRRARRIFTAEHNQLWPNLLDLYKAIVYRQAGRRTRALLLARRAQDGIPASWMPAKALMAHLLEAQLLLEAGYAALARDLCVRAIAGSESAAPAVRFHAWFLLAQVEEARRDWTACHDACLKAATQVEGLRNRLSGEEIKISFLKDKLAVYETLVWLCLEHPERDHSIEAALEHIQHAKSRVLADHIAGLEHPSPEHWYYRRIESEASQGREGAAKRIGLLRQEARRSDAQGARLATHPALLAGEDQLPVEVLCRAVPADAILIEYFRVRGAFQACLVSRGGVEMIPLGDAATVRQRLHLLQFQLAKIPLGPPSAVENHLRGLHDLLFAPLVRSLRARHLIIAPHSFLHHLPFHALHDGSRFLCDEFTVSYAPSATVYALCAGRATGNDNGESLVLGVPDEGMPYVVREVETVAEQLPAVRVFLRNEANGEVFRQYAPRSRYIHVATHGVFLRDNPLFSSIRLGNSQLSLLDLYQISLSAELVTLSGCSTGLHAVEGGDELVGLVRGLLRAGARSALVSLWDVNDSSTADLMGKFYHEMRAGRDKAGALTCAVRAIREHQPHPYYWAPFVLVGKYQ